MKIYINFLRYFINLIDFSFQKKIINFFKKNLNENLIFFDVGSHHGETVELFEKNLDIKEFHCFEPSQENFKILTKNILKKNFYNKVNLNNYGLGKSHGVFDLNFTKETSSSTINTFNKRSKYLSKKLNILNISDLSEYYKKEKINIKTLDEYFVRNKISKIDILKIDTEGFEFNVLKGFIENIANTKFIYFEHHFDDMIIKDYKLSDIHSFLKKNNFQKKFKVKMNFRKSFEYIYENNKK